MSLDKLPEAVRKRVQHLHELAQRGVGGEALNASEFLLKLLKKHSLTLDDLSNEEKKEEREFKLGRNKFAKTIFYAVAARALAYDPARSKDIFVYIKPKLVGAVVCTTAEAVQISMEMDLYTKAFRSELELFQRAFFMGNDLLIDPAFWRNEQDTKPLTAEERENIHRVAAMAAGVKSVPVRRQISTHT